MADKTTDDNMFDEKVIGKKIAEEQDLLTRLQMDLNERQDRKKKVNATIRSLTHKIKAMEEEITKDALAAEALKRDKEKYVTKVDAKVVNKQIDRKCEDIFGELLQTVNPGGMQIEVQFEDLRTTFNISDHRVNNHYENRETEDDSALRGSVREDSVQGSVLSSDTHTGIGTKSKKSFICRTFGEMKEDVAAFFSLSADCFFFADDQNAVFLDDLPIRPTLFPFGQKITKTLPRLNIILTNNAKYDEMIFEKIKEQIGDVEVVDNTQQRAEQKEAYDNEQARKKADQKRKSAAQYYQFKKKVYKFKGMFSSLLYVVLIILWLYNVLSNFEFDETFLMRSSTETLFESYADAINTAEFYQKLKDQLFNTDHISSAYGFVHFNYFMPGAEVVCKRYKQTNCTFATAYMNKYYPSVEGTCVDSLEQSKEPFQANGVTYYYNEDHNKKLSLPTRKGSFDNQGFRLQINYSDPDMQQKIADFVDPFVAEFVSFNFVLYNPGLEKMACVYRMVYRYNRDKTTNEIFSYIFNVRRQTQASLVIQELVLVIASLLVLNSIFDMIDIVPASKVELDLDLVWIRKAKKGALKEGEAKRHKQKFKMITLGGTVFKISFPSFVNLLNLLSVILNVWVVALDLDKHKIVDKIDFTTGEGMNCATLIGRKSVTEILYVIIIMLMMIVLLRYISQYIRFIQYFFMIIQRLVSNTSSLGILILWLFLTLTLFGVFTFGSFYPGFESFGYMYTSIVLLLMKKNVILSDTPDITYYNRMSKNIGTGALIGMMIFIYVVISLIIVKTITSIVIRSIKEAEGNKKSEELEEEKRTEESLTLIREKFYEEFRQAQNKMRAKSHDEAVKQSEAKDRLKKKN